jgi:hypothetical protein
LSFALLIFAAYLIFDVLDVDGSQMTGWVTNDMVMTQQVDAERLCRADLSISGSTDLLYPSLPRLLSTANGAVSSATTILRMQRRESLPRVNLHQEMSRASSPIADPA